MATDLSPQERDYLYALACSGPQRVLRSSLSDTTKTLARLGYVHIYPVQGRGTSAADDALISASEQAMQALEAARDAASPLSR